MWWLRGNLITADTLSFFIIYFIIYWVRVEVVVESQSQAEPSRGRIASHDLDRDPEWFDLACTCTKDGFARQGKVLLCGTDRDIGAYLVLQG